mmetsp:Transcript_42672/g.62723  ORF Transcript_42672/g.62723 Transcript_42672/m.62723 type:complete len:118 (-) Transcript_42672:198-551(-)
MAADTAAILIEQAMNEAMEHVTEAMEEKKMKEKEIDEEKLPEPLFSDSLAIDSAYLEYLAKWLEWSVEETRDHFEGLAETKDLDYVNKFLDNSLNTGMGPKYNWRDDALKEAGIAAN